MSGSILLAGAQQVVTCRGPARARRGREMADVEVISHGALVMEQSRVVAAGPYTELRSRFPAAQVVEVRGVLIPGLIDCHTHAVFGAPRLDDHERRALGQSYQAIAAAGGGILESVRDVRERPEAELVALSARRIATLVSHGSTTIEVKSGYGLDLESELKQLRVVRDLAASQPATLVPTLLAAHEIPPDFRARRAEYVRRICDEVIPRVAREALAASCDVFCEPGVFSPDDARAILTAARQYGLSLRLHADEFESSGGAELAVELGALSADHLAAIAPAGIAALGRGNTVAVLLPSTMAFLGKSQAPARRLIDAGAPVALATDFNPGSSPTVSLPLVMALGVAQLGMRYTEALIAVTVNAAAALGLADRGQLAPGFRADVVAFAVKDWREIGYWLGANLVSVVWTAGLACMSQQGPVSLGLNVQD